ncbi:MobA/MobL family protein [[Eubacterium] tenue]|nr:MobQ family relaxase [[Eubacterium] tenue]MBC8632827.1 MobA/MobL family protein [[Eubacterium] tenue]
MAIYHLSTKIISRSKGKSSIASSAYRSGEKLYNKRDGLIHDYTKRKDVIYKEIFKPINAPNWVLDREQLWNEVEQIEKSKNSQLAREIDIALPIELNEKERIELLREYVIANFSNKGMVADVVIHDKKDGNPHSHIMLTMRPFEENGEWGAKAKKEYILDKNGNKTYSKNGNAKSRKIETTNWNKKETLEHWREQWAIYANKALEKANRKERIDHRSYEDRGIDKLATRHEGPTVRAMEKKGIKTEIGDINRKIQEENKKIYIIENQIKLYEEMKELENERTKDNGARNRNIETEEGVNELTKGIGGLGDRDRLEVRKRTEELKKITRDKREQDRAAREELRKYNERIERRKMENTRYSEKKSNTDRRTKPNNRILENGLEL